MDVAKVDRFLDDLLKTIRTTLNIEYKILNLSVGLLRFTKGNCEFGTNGKDLVYNPYSLILTFKDQEDNYLVHMYLHTLLHCLYHHINVEVPENIDYWNLACDIAVESTILESFTSNKIVLEDDNQRISALRTIKRSIKLLTAQHIYEFLIQNVDEDDFIYYSSIFHFDDHSLWYQRVQDGSNSTGNGNMLTDDELEEAMERWKDVANSMKVDMESLSQDELSDSNVLSYNLKEVTREKYDYSTFLRRFASLNEVMKLDLDEFDYLFYTYGLNQYGNVPLIEPLEYKEDYIVKEFAIIIDTSGSTSGELVETFLNKTYNILKSTESFDQKVNIHIIQCDDDVRSDVKITNQSELEDYIHNLEIIGLGGTDFRPAIEYVEELKDNHEFTNLKGAIYFTDGYGTYPSTIPSFECAFVFIDDEFNDYNVPVWAIKIILRENEI